jgi:Uma2 family endonuclease
METTQTRPQTDYERERGKPLPSFQHSRIQTRLSAALFQHEPDVLVFNELTIELDGYRITPDLCVLPPMDVEPTSDINPVTEPPLIAIEISSPSQPLRELVDKAKELIDRGVHTCWIIEPAIRTVTVLDSDVTLTTITEGIVEDANTGIRVSLDDIFGDA